MKIHGTSIRTSSFQNFQQKSQKSQIIQSELSVDSGKIHQMKKLATKNSSLSNKRQLITLDTNQKLNKEGRDISPLLKSGE
jgi:hypothetical protein